MKKIVKWVGLGVVVVFALLAGRAGVEIGGNYLGWNDDEETIVHKTLEKMAEALNKDLPKQLGEDTWLEVQVSPTENKLIYRYVIGDREAFDENTIQQYLQNAFCTEAGLQIFRKGNVVVDYRYTSVDGNFISSIEVGNYGCE
tara:strand:- start:608 stop:1036 length:429 start_codon:yes stop_codon:yes gene_type:complete